MQKQNERFYRCLNKLRDDHGFTRKQTEDVLKLIQDMIKHYQLQTDDPRLALTFSRYNDLSVNIGNRYVFAIRKMIGFITPLDFDHKSRVWLDTNIGYFQSNKEKKFQWIRFNKDHISKFMNDNETLKIWTNTVGKQLELFKGSPQKRFHQDIFYQLIVNKNFQEEVLDQVYSSNDIIDRSKEIKSLLNEKFPTFKDIKQALERKKQVILYGPPGTGKTYQASVFSVYFLLQDDPKRHGELLEYLQGSDNKGLENQLLGDHRLSYFTFHPSYSYEEFIEGIKPIQVNNKIELRLQKGVFADICNIAAREENAEKNYVVVIDEINRAHLTKVFGELITVLESDKRGNQIRLPYSKEYFTVPPNVYLIGTMNTADFSVKSLDIALRRRFAFLEFHPDYDLLDLPIGGLHIGELLRNLNSKITEVFGREKQIGHAYLLEDGVPVSTVEELYQVLVHDIIRLLEDYCHSDYSQLTKFLGEKIVKQENQQLNYDIVDYPHKLIQELQHHYSE